jgi:hypothetical protein
MDTLLVTVLGTKPRPARYMLNERVEKAPLAPAALFRLLPESQRPQRILALCTATAREQSLSMLREALAGQAVKIDCADISEEPADHTTLLARLYEPIRVEDKPRSIIFDITHGPRQFAFYVMLAIQYLSVLREIPLEGAYYAWLRDEPEPSPLIDLRPLLDMVESVHAVRVFTESGDAGPLAERIRAANGQSAKRIARELLWISQARAAGLPLELGLFSQGFSSHRREFRRILRSRGALLEDELWHRLETLLQRFSFETAAGSKGKLTLNRAELLRQAELINDLLKHGMVPVALGLMDEWTISWALLCDGPSEEWLDYHGERRTTAAKLGLLRSLAADQELQAILSPAQRELGNFWGNLSDLRNAYAHHGMRSGELIGSSSDARQAGAKRVAIEHYWQRLKAGPEIPINLATTGKLLVSAQGTSPGVLFSAIEACRRESRAPDKCLVLCSAQSEDSAKEACRKSEFSGPLELIRFADPYGGRSEIKRIEQAARKHLIEAGQVLVNLTGGTTLMGLAVAAIAESAKRFARPVRRFGLIDPRPPAEQQADPYRASEAFWLD